MRCFLGCFGGGKNRRRPKRTESDQASPNELGLESAKPDHVIDREHTVEEISKPKAYVEPVTEICPSPTKKRVTFDSKVKTYEHIVVQESVEKLEEKRGEEVESSLKLSKSGQTSSENREVGTYPSNHRYTNCRESDDDEVEEDELDGIESDLDEDEEYYSDEGLSEDKLRNSTKEGYTEEIGGNGLEAGDAKSRGVLEPVENLTQWKSAKSKGRTTMQKLSQKENSNLISDQGDKRDDSFSFSEDRQIDDIPLSYKSISRTELKKPRNQELTVEASLSTWLSKSETGSECNSVNMETATPEKNKSSSYSRRGINLDDRPILCALTVEDIKHFSAASTPRKSPSKSPDETPIIGTVGGYWGNHSKAIDIDSTSSFKGIPNTTSKYREDKSVNWHSTPFEARLEKAMNRDK